LNGEAFLLDLPQGKGPEQSFDEMEPEMLKFVEVVVPKPEMDLTIPQPLGLRQLQGLLFQTPIPFLTLGVELVEVPKQTLLQGQILLGMPGHQPLVG